MNATNRYLNDLAAKLGGASDYRLGKVLELSHAAISHYRTGRSNFDAKTCVKVAAILGIDPFQIIAAVEADRAKNDDDRGFWKGQLKHAAAVALGSILLLGGIPQEARAARVSADSANFTILNILHLIRVLLARKIPRSWDAAPPWCFA